MAVLPVYSDQGSISSGGDTLRLNHKEDGGGAALAHLGSALGNYAVAEAGTDAKIAAIEDKEQKRVAGLGDSLIRADMETSWHAKQAQLEDNIDPSGKDYTQQVSQAFEEHLAEYEGKWSGRLYGENQVLNARLRKGVVERAIDVEKQTIYKSQLAVGKQIINDAAVTVGANPDAFEAVLQDAELKANVLDFQGKVREPFLRDVRRSAEIGRANAYVAANPAAALDAAKGAIAGFPTQEAPPEQSKVINAAKATDMDPSLLLAIGHIESRFNTDAVSSAGFKGVFQTKGETSVYGPHDAKDTFAQGVATGTFLAARQQDMRERGLDATPGRTFMFHNVGEGVAWKLISEQDPTKTMGQLLYETYGDSKFANGQLKRDVVGRNNPSLYNPNMTVADVRANYENVVRGAMGATSGFVSEGGAPDDHAKAALSKMLGVDVQQLGAADLANISNAAAASIGKQTKADLKTQLGVDIFQGNVRMQPFNKEHQAAVDEIVKTQFPDVADKLLQSGPPEAEAISNQAFAQAGNFVRANSYIPHQWRDAVRELVMNGNAKNPAKVRAYNFLVEVQKHNPTAYEASGIDADVTKRVDLFARGMERTSNASQTLDFISREFSQEHKETRQALQKIVDSDSKQHPGEVQRLKFTDVTDMFKRDEGLWRAPIEPENSAQEELLMNGYKQLYKEYRYMDHSPDVSKDLALSDLKKSWGISVAFVGPTQAARFMQNPPDRFYAQPIVGMKPFEDQAREVVGQELARRFPADVQALASNRAYDQKNVGAGGLEATNRYDAASVEIQILPARSTNEEARKGSSSPHFQVAYRDPRTGQIAVANDNWQPNKDRMEAEANTAMQEHRAAVEAKRKRIDAMSSGVQGLGAAGGGLQ